MANDKGFFNYWVVANSGQGFITHEDSREWGARNSATSKTKSEAQTIVTGVVDDAKDTWDNDNVDGESAEAKINRLGPKPTTITLP